MPRAFRPNSLCKRCLIHGRPLSTSRTLSQRQHNLPPSPPLAGYTQLTNRSLISLSGADSTEFLQGLTTQNIRVPKNKVLPKTAFYTAFLNSQGRVLNDAFIYPSPPSSKDATQVSSASTGSSPGSDPAYLIEVDTAEVKSFLKHLKKHKLRSKLNFRALDQEEQAVWALWDENDTPGWKEYRARQDSLISCVDHRAPALGYRFIAAGGNNKLQGVKEFLPGEEVPVPTYTLRRILHGVPEGQGEMVRESALPMDSNMDVMNGIDFHKGCYLGQELTIRTHHRGVIRKRILPVQLYDFEDHLPDFETPVYDPDTNLVLPPTGGNISKVSARKGRSAGKFITGIGNIGLAVCRLEMMTDIALTGESTQYDADQEFAISWDGEAEGVDGAGQVKVKALVPPWTREYIISGGAKQRVSKSEAQRAKEMVEQLEEETHQLEQSER